jgi:phosphoesterase RecJ-like protein
VLGSLDEVALAIKRYQRFLLTWHVDPDPDSVGSGLALQKALEQLGKEAVCISPDPLGDWYDFLPGVEACLAFHTGIKLDFDAAIVLDCEPDRCGGLVEYLNSGIPIINVDHHGTNLGFGKAFYVNPQAAATGEIIYELLKNHWQTPLTEEIATNLFASLSADTGTFRYSNTSGKTLQIAGELVQHGANPAEIAVHLHGNRSYEAVNLIRRALDTLEISQDGLVSWITVTRAMSGEEGWHGQQSEDIIQFPRMIKTVKLAILFREIEPEKTKASFRSRADIDASYIAGLFGGGGHAQAAGCTIDSPLAEARAQVLDAVIRELDHHKQAIIGERGDSK